jgi:hypothetical protein
VVKINQSLYRGTREIVTHTETSGQTVEPTKITKEEEIIKPDGKIIDEPPVVFIIRILGYYSY